MKLKKIKTDRLLGISAMIISLLTLIIFIYQTNIMREQSKLSVKPRLNFSTNFNESDSLVIIEQVIENRGLGPAIIDSISFQYNDKAYVLDIEDLIRMELPKLFKYGRLSQYATLERGSTLMPGEEKPIYTYNVSRINLDSIYDYLKINTEDDSPIPIEVIYTSIYEDTRWMVHSNKKQPLEID